MSNILEVNNLSILLGDKAIVKNISFEVNKNRILGIVGESGSGKSVTMYSITNLLSEKNFNIKGSIVFNGQDILQLQGKERRKFCSGNISIILQDSINALNPYKKISTQLVETIRLHEGVDRVKALEIAGDMLREVGLEGTYESMDKYAHEYSGGMRQRIAIALCLSCKPKLIIADEPTTSLDAINQLKFMDYIKKICVDKNISLIYISHNLGLVASICEDVIVMNNGSIVESGQLQKVFSNPEKDYTKNLVNATRDLVGRQEYGNNKTE